MNKIELIQNTLGFDPKNKIYKNLNKVAEYAPTNFALIKYWGKENEELMIPKTDSLSISLGKNCGTITEISISDSNNDILIFDDQIYTSKSDEYKKIFDFIDMFRPFNLKLKVCTKNNLPKASGLATSASGFAALVLALNSFFNWKLSSKKLSILARLGSISASRSIYQDGLVKLTCKNNSPYAYSYRLSYKIKGLCIGLIIFNNKPKKISSKDGMKITVNNSILYKYGWKKQVEHDLKFLLKAFKHNDWNLFKKTVQNNALAMHATAISSGVIYWSVDTLQTIEKILSLQNEGVEICFTEDAGEHIKILARDENTIRKFFPEAVIYNIF